MPLATSRTFDASSTRARLNPRRFYTAYKQRPHAGSRASQIRPFPSRMLFKKRAIKVVSYDSKRVYVIMVESTTVVTNHKDSKEWAAKAVLRRKLTAAYDGVTESSFALVVSGNGELALVSPVIGEKIDDILARTLMKSAARSQFASSTDTSLTIVRRDKMKASYYSQWTNTITKCVCASADGPRMRKAIEHSMGFGIRYRLMSKRLFGIGLLLGSVLQQLSGLLCHILFRDVLTSNKLIREDLLLPRTEVRIHSGVVLNPLTRKFGAVGEMKNIISEC
ncbi:hypothetical protein EAG_15730 [Camponotus floridanus]|uniref:Uncharacterized protein n=1 Tax=Camponotus floridanus TaxID=104421 RepID=E2AXC1_CAMFO|nr:hypothetical protein EAG_15730 [Camponotus floridanus]